MINQVYDYCNGDAAKISFLQRHIASLNESKRQYAIDMFLIATIQSDYAKDMKDYKIARKLARHYNNDINAFLDNFNDGDDIYIMYRKIKPYKVKKSQLMKDVIKAIKASSTDMELVSELMKIETMLLKVLPVNYEAVLPDNDCVICGNINIINQAEYMQHDNFYINYKICNDCKIDYRILAGHYYRKLRDANMMLDRLRDEDL